jgi:nucleoside-diphosphate-sugar epimerase
MVAADVVNAVQGAQLLFHGVNPPGYRNWRELAIPMLSNSITAAKASGARLIFPGNLYNFDPDAGTLVDETTQQRPLTRKGKVRAEMEQMLADASHEGVRSLIVRAGDFFGSGPTQSWFNGVIVRPGKALRSITYPGRPDAGHAWAYLPDLAETIVRLADMERQLSAFEVVNFGGHWLERGIVMAEAIRRATGRTNVPIRSMPWPLLYLASPFVPLFRELIEMRYLWMTSIRLDNRKLVELIGSEPHTPLDTAIAVSLAEIGCLPDA